MAVPLGPSNINSKRRPPSSPPRPQNLSQSSFVVSPAGPHFVPIIHQCISARVGYLARVSELEANLPSLPSTPRSTRPFTPLPESRPVPASGFPLFGCFLSPSSTSVFPALPALPGKPLVYSISRVYCFDFFDQHHPSLLRSTRHHWPATVVGQREESGMPSPTPFFLSSNLSSLAEKTPLLCPKPIPPTGPGQVPRPFYLRKPHNHSPRAACVATSSSAGSTRLPAVSTRLDSNSTPSGPRASCPGITKLAGLSIAGTPPSNTPYPSNAPFTPPRPTGTLLSSFLRLHHDMPFHCLDCSETQFFNIHHDHAVRNTPIDLLRVVSSSTIPPSSWSSPRSPSSFPQSKPSAFLSSV